MDDIRQLNAALAGRYEIAREIGAGGMATVFAATDLRHNRLVAVKVLRPELSAAVAVDRFDREIHLVARLRHPHIVPLFDSGEANGARYYVMPLVEGESLRSRLEREGALSLADAARIGCEVAEALDYAHQHGVVHRDVKPENILIENGHAIVTDFGIALAQAAAERQNLTMTGVIVGTPAYMSPEQVSGERDIDAHSDQYSLACVTFEMLAGRAPFTSDGGRAVHMRHLMDPVPSIRTIVPDLPESVDATLQRAMEKDPARRFGNLRDFAAALGAGGMASVSQIGNAPMRRSAAGVRAGPAWLYLAASVLVATALVTGLIWRATTAGRNRGAPDGSRPVPAPAAGERPSVAVFPFESMSGGKEDEYFSAGITEELIGALNQVGRLRVPSRTSSVFYKNRGMSLRATAESLHVATVLEGSVQRSGDRVRIRATLVRASNDSTLWADEFDRKGGDVLALEADIAGAIAGRMLSTLLPSDRAALAIRATVNPEAHDRYLRGRFYWNQRTPPALLEAVRFFREALAIDPAYARAYAGLADTYTLLPWTGAMPPREAAPLARAAAERALQLDSTLSDAHVSLGMVHLFSGWNADVADQEFARALTLDPSNANAHLFRAFSLSVQGRLDEALRSIERARSLEPLSLIINARVANMFAYQKRLAEAESAGRKALQIDPSFAVARAQLARALVAHGRAGEALTVLPPAGAMLGSMDAGIRGVVFAASGQPDRARQEIRSLTSRAYFASDAVAVIYAALGETDPAIQWLERSEAARDISVVFIKVEPLFDSLRGDPRFKAILARMGLKG